MPEPYSAPENLPERRRKMGAESQTRRARSPEYDWASSRLRGGKMPAFHVTPVRGYGAGGNYTLYLPSPESKRSIKFVDGLPTVQVLSVAIDDELSRIRDLAIVSARPDAPVNLQINFDKTIAVYSAKALSRVYDLTDDDLTLLHTGRSWIEPVFVHAMGGKDSVDALSRIYMRVMSELPIQQTSTTVVEDFNPAESPVLVSAQDDDEWID